MSWLQPWQRMGASALETSSDAFFHSSILLLSNWNHFGVTVGFPNRNRCSQLTISTAALWMSGSNVGRGSDDAGNRAGAADTEITKWQWGRAIQNRRVHKKT